MGVGKLFNSGMRSGRNGTGVFPMDLLRWTLIFLVFALIAAVFGFSGIAANFAYIGKILFFIFIVMFVISLLFGRRRG